MQELITRAKELLADGTVSRVLGWKKGDMGWDPEPAYFEKEEDLKDFVYNPFCGANLSKYLIAAGKLEGTTLVFLKPCDTYSFNQLTKEHRVKREKTYIIGVGCHGTLKAEKVLSAGIKGIEDAAIEGDTLKVKTLYGEKEMPLMDVFLERCKVCKGKTHVVFDELIGAEEGEEAGPGELAGNRFAKVEELEAMPPKVYPPRSVVKVGDTVVDMQEGRNAGAWSVGILTGSNLLGLSQEEYEAMDSAELEKRKEKATERYREAGADLVIDSIWELPAAIEELNRRLQKEGMEA